MAFWTGPRPKTAVDPLSSAGTAPVELVRLQ